MNMTKDPSKFLTRNQLKRQLEVCHHNTKLVALVSLIIGVLIGKLS